MNGSSSDTKGGGGAENGASSTLLQGTSAWKLYGALALCLFVLTFGFSGIFTAVLCAVLAVAGVMFVLLNEGWYRSHELASEFDSVDYRHSVGLQKLLRRSTERLDKGADVMTGSPALDPILEEILTYTLRDFVEPWYSVLTTDELMKESLKRSSRRTIAALTICLRRIDWVPLLTRHIVDDFASHVRLYRKSKERIDRQLKANKVSSSGDQANNVPDLESVFFDLELEMEKSYCRDLVSTSAQYEQAYLHDICDILLYLLVPLEDFRCRPLRLLLREILVNRLFIPLIDHLTDPDYINFIIVWLMADAPVSPEDFVLVLESTKSLEELNAIGESLDEEIALQRAKDTGGQDASAVKQKLGSLRFVRRAVDERIKQLNNNEIDYTDAPIPPGSDLFELPIRFVLANSISLSFFIDFLQSVGGHTYIDCYLAIEGFKVSTEHQMKGLRSCQTKDPQANAMLQAEVLETLREAAKYMYQQYLSEEAIDRVPLDENVVSKFLSRVKSGTDPANWFDAIQKKIVDVLSKDPRFYPAFRKNHMYYRMLKDLALFTPSPRSPSSNSDRSTKPTALLDHSVSCDDGRRSASPVLARDHFSADTISLGSLSEPDLLMEGAVVDTSDMPAADRYGVPAGDEDEPARLTVDVSTLGIGRQGTQSFALYNVRVGRVNSRGEQLSCWNVLRRYSDFHTLHNVIEHKFPALATLSFPGKKTFNNLGADFLERRTKALNSYMLALAHPDLMRIHRGLDIVVMNFLCQKEYNGEKGMFGKKVVNAVMNPIKFGVGVFGNAVTASSDMVYGGVAQVGAGINKAAKQVLASAVRQPSSSNSLPDATRVGASINESTQDSIPLRVMLLFVDEVFGLRARNQWFRRRLVAFLRHFLHVTFGSSINRKIVEMVVWLTGEEQVAEYLRAFKNSFWPNGQLGEASAERPHGVQMRTRVLAKAKLLAMLPDELRLFIGNETSRSGIEVIFDALQQRHLNRRLVYVLLERLLLTVFPNNRFNHVLPKLHSKSPRCRPDEK